MSRSPPLRPLYVLDRKENLPLLVNLKVRIHCT